MLQRRRVRTQSAAQVVPTGRKSVEEGVMAAQNSLSQPHHELAAGVYPAVQVQPRHLQVKAPGGRLRHCREPGNTKRRGVSGGIRRQTTTS